MHSDQFGDCPHLTTEVREYARGSAPTGVGTVSVDWRKDPHTGEVHLQAIAPEGIPTRVRLPGLEPTLYPAGGEIGLRSTGA